MSAVGGNRGRLMLQARRAAAMLKRPPLGAPPPRLDEAECDAWRDIAAASAIPLIDRDDLALQIVAATVVHVRRGGATREFVREAYRQLGDYFIAMPERRRLLFPDLAGLK